MQRKISSNDKADTEKVWEALHKVGRKCSYHVKQNPDQRVGGGISWKSTWSHRIVSNRSRMRWRKFLHSLPVNTSKQLFATCWISFDFVLRYQWKWVWLSFAVHVLLLYLKDNWKWLADAMNFESKANKIFRLLEQWALGDFLDDKFSVRDCGYDENKKKTI